jgi:hypothetical protein
MLNPRSLAGFIILIGSIMSAQDQPETRTLSVNGHSGPAAIVQGNGHTYIDLEALARISSGSLSFRADQITLILPAASADTPAPSSPPKAAEAGLSQNFMMAGIEALARMREWASTLANAIQHGYGVTEEWEADYQAEAAHSLRLATAAASTGSDRNGLDLLTNEFEAVQEWSNKLLAAKQAMDTAKYTSNPNALREDQLSQKIITCGHFLGTMLGSGEFKEDPSCR